MPVGYRLTAGFQTINTSYGSFLVCVSTIAHWVNLGPSGASALSLKFTHQWFNFIKTADTAGHTIQYYDSILYGRL